MDITDNVNLIQTADDGTRTAKRGFNSSNRYFEQIETDNGGGGSTVAIPSIYTISNGGNITVSTSTTSNATFENVRTFTLGVDTDSTVTSGSAKPVTSGAVYSSLLDKQDTLVSSTNIKTINGSSVLGSGDLAISATASFASITGDPGDNENLVEWFDAKANTDLSNLDATGKSYGASLALPSDNWVDLTIGASGATYTAPANGYFACRNQSAQTYLSIKNMNSTVVENEQMASWLPINGNSCYIPVKKGQTVQLNYSANSFFYFRFIYAEGEI